ncbi:MAG: hypothetical protein P8Z68_12495 [Kineosporiaceae bacterium]
MPLPEPGQVGGGEPAFHRAHQQVAQLIAETAEGADLRAHRGRPGRGPTDPGLVPGEQLSEDPVLLGAGDEAGRHVTVEHEPPPEHPESVGGEGTGGRFAHRAGQPDGQPLPQPGGRLPGRGEEEQAVRGNAVTLHPGGERLDEHRRLAGAGPAEHDDGTLPLPVRDDGLLGVVECDRTSAPPFRGPDQTDRRQPGTSSFGPLWYLGRFGYAGLVGNLGSR